MNFQMFKLVLEKAYEQDIKLPTSAGSSKKQEEFQKNIYFCFIDSAKAFNCVDHSKLWKILKEMGISHHLTCLPRLTIKLSGRENMAFATSSHLEIKFTIKIFWGTCLYLHIFTVVLENTL